MVSNKINIRKIELKDYEYIDKWWIEQGFSALDKSILPMNGLGGIIIEKNKPIAVGYLYLTNSKMGYCDYLISNPNYKSRDRFKIITKLMIAAVETAYSIGVKDFWFITNNPSMVKRCKELDVHVSESTYNLVLPLRYNKKGNVRERGF